MTVKATVATKKLATKRVATKRATKVVSETNQPPIRYSTLEMIKERDSINKLLATGQYTLAYSSVDGKSYTFVGAKIYPEHYIKGCTLDSRGRISALNGVWYFSSNDRQGGCVITYVGDKYLEALNNAKGILAWRDARYHNYTGCDPEFFFADKDGRMLPSTNFLPAIKAGKKHAPNSLYSDGYQAEFNPAANTCLDGLRSTISSILSSARRHFTKAEGGITSRNTFILSPEQLQNDPPHLVNFGCTPSLNAYGEPSPLAGVDARTIPIRSAGGHMHFSVRGKLSDPAGKLSDPAVIVKKLDAIAGVIFVKLFRYWDNPLRRKFYGRAGEYRTPSYGIEYRVPSNAWLMHPLLYNISFEIARRAIGVGLAGEHGDKMWVADEQEVRDCINNCDVSLANKIIEQNKEQFEYLISDLCYAPVFTTGALTVKWLIEEGAHVAFDNPDVINTYGWASRSPETVRDLCAIVQGGDYKIKLT